MKIAELGGYTDALTDMLANLQRVSGNGQGNLASSGLFKERAGWDQCRTRERITQHIVEG